MWWSYPQQVVRAGIQDAWQRRPVSLETCGTPGDWRDKGWDLDAILAQALRWHVSSLNVKSSPIPPNGEPVRRLPEEHGISLRPPPSRVSEVGEGGRNDAHAHVVAQRRRRAYLSRIRACPRAASATGSTLIRVPAKLKEWLPGDAVVDRSLYFRRAWRREPTASA